MSHSEAEREQLQTSSVLAEKDETIKTDSPALQPNSQQNTFSNLQIDYVIVFSLKPIDKTIDKSTYASKLIEEYQLLIRRLEAAGLSATSRPGSKASQELLILVTAHNETRIKREIQAERIADWLHGITSIKPQSDLARSFLSQPYTPADRLRHIYNIITRDVKPYESESPISAHPHRPLIGIGAGIIPRKTPFEHVKSIFPPHDTNFNKTWLSHWSDRSHLTIKLPQVELDKIKEVYGESIAYYFAFLNFYFQSLIFPTGLGFFVWITGMVNSSTYSIILILWSMVFVEMWKIKEKLLAIKWNSFNCHKVEKRRVEFIPEKIIRHLVTNEPVGYFPWWKRESKKLVTIPVLILFALGISALITAITAIELVVAEVYTGPFKKALALLPTVLFAASVPQVVGLWQSTGVKLSNWENHSYNSAYDRSLTYKVFMMQGLVAYAGLALTAFIYVPFGAILVPHLAGLTQSLIKQDSIPLEGSPDLYLNTHALDFSTYSINTARLYEQLFAYQVTNQLVDTFTEVGLPYIMKIASCKWNQIRSERQHKSEHPPSNRSSPYRHANDEPDERELLERLREETRLPEYRLFVEYAEMAIQFGYIVLWTVVWPISPVFSFVNNFFELRTDAIKLTKHSRRPIPARCDSIGPWVDVLTTLSWIGVIINAVLVHIFQPGQKLVDSYVKTKHKETSIGTSVTIVADLFTAAIMNGENRNGNVQKGNNSQQGIYERLSSILLTILISVLLSEHVFFVVRYFVRESIRRLMWKDSEADVKQQRAEWELKQTFIKRLDMSQDSTADFYFSTGESTRTQQDQLFWSKEEAGIREIQCLLKTD